MLIRIPQTLICYTLDAVTVDICYRTGQNVDITAADLPDLTQSRIDRLTYGSKMQLTAWYSYTALIWCLKFTMLFFYRRLTLGSLQNKMVRYLFWICGATYIAVFLTVTFGCHPYHLNWQVSPITPWKCSFRLQNFIVTAVLNILTDIALLLIPVPLLWKLKIPIQKKLVISLILSSGLFVITAAIIRIVYTLDADPSGSNINRWGVRETIIGIAAVNLPILRPLLNKPFWTYGPYDPMASGPSAATGSRTWKSQRLGDTSKTDVELGSTVISPHRISTSSSQENIRDWDQKKDNVVYVQTTYETHSQDREGESGSMRGNDTRWG